MHRTRPLVFIITIVLLLFSAAVYDARAEDLWKVTASVEYETGKYDTGTRTDTWYFPVTVKRYFEKGDISLTVPYIRQRSNPEVAAVDGTVFRIRRQPGGPVTTNSGLGDIILRGSYYVLTEGSKDPFDFSVVGKIKFPTADDKKGLGTGEFDEGVGVELAKNIGSDSTVFADFTYTFIGDPPGIDLKDRFSFDIGVSSKITPELTASIFYEESTALLADNPAVRDVAANVDYMVTKEFHVFGGALVGLTKTSPDYGISAGVSVKF